MVLRGCNCLFDACMALAIYSYHMSRAVSRDDSMAPAPNDPQFSCYDDWSS